MFPRLTSTLNRIRSSEFIRNSAVMMTGTGIAQIIPVLIIPVLTRLYAPGEIGILAAFVSLFTIFSVIAGGRYEFGIIMPESDRTGTNLLYLSGALSVLSGIVLALVVLFFGGQVARAVNAPLLEPWLWLLPVTVTAQGLFMAFSFALNRNKQYHSIAAGKVTQTGTTAAVQTLGGISGWGVGGLIIGKAVGVIISAGWLITALQRKVPRFLERVKPEELKKAAAEFISYPKYNAPHALVNSISSNLPVILFITFFSDAIAGFYAMAFRASYAPVQIVSAAVGQVFGKRLADKKHEQADVRSYVVKMLLLFAAIGIIPFGLLFLAGPAVFGYILGSEWAVTGDYVRILIPYVYLTFITQPLSYIPLLYERQKQAFILFLFSLLLRVLAIFSGIWLDMFLVSLALYSATGVVVLLYHIYWYLSLCDTDSVTADD
ncbi:oligosaccharide flippase family protein [Balneolales bacterium ANBcel1]|nr:oligosaccharide flippase family protein [Balneolales bacterium ANBcel1]